MENLRYLKITLKYISHLPFITDCRYHATAVKNLREKSAAVFCEFAALGSF